MFGRRKSAENRPTLENRLHRKLVTTPEQLQKKNKEKPPRRLDLTVPSHGRDECHDRGSLPPKGEDTNDPLRPKRRRCTGDTRHQTTSRPEAQPRRQATWPQAKRQTRRARQNNRPARQENRYAPARLQDSQDPGLTEAARPRFPPATAEDHRLAGSLGARLPQRHAHKEDRLARRFGQAAGRPAHLPRHLQLVPPTPPRATQGGRRCFLTSLHA